MIPSHALAAVSASELARAATMFTTIKQLRLRVSSIEESILDEAFETHVQSVLEKLDERLPNIEDSTVREVNDVQQRSQSFDMKVALRCFDLFISLQLPYWDIHSYLDIYIY